MKFLPLSASLMAVLAISAAAQKSKPQPIPAAPIPEGIAAAKTVFLANICEMPYSYCAPVYNRMYAGIAKQGKYQLVSSPAQADLVLELHTTMKSDQKVSGPHFFPDNDLDFIVELKIVDRATGTPLWMITEPETEKSSAEDAVLLDLSVLGRPGETAGPIVNFPPKKK